METKIKIAISVFFSIFILQSVNAQVVRLSRVQANGTTIIQSIPENTTSLVLFDSDANGYHTKSFYGLEKLKNLKILEFQTLAFLKEYNFLRAVTVPEELYIAGGVFNDFSVINNMHHLRVFDMSAAMSKSAAEKLKKDGCDFSDYAELQKIVFEPVIRGKNISGYERFGTVPRFTVIPGKVSLQITNDGIQYFTADDIQVLRQFTFVDVSFNPACSNVQELKKLDRAGIKYRSETLK